MQHTFTAFTVLQRSRALVQTCSHSCRVQVGDASASHSPLSFGGFGSMLRHLPRLSQGLHTALQQGQLTRSTLAGLQVRLLAERSANRSLAC